MTDIIVEITGAGGATNLTALTDTNLTGTVDGQVLTYNSATLKWIPTAAAGVSTIAALNDVNLAGIADGNVIKWDAGNAEFIVAADDAGGQVTSVAGRTGAVVIVKADIADFGTYATTAQGTLADSALQPLDNISTLINDAGYITSVAAAPVDSVAGKTGVVTLVKADITDFGTYATTAQGTLADSATQPSDNISTLTNDSGFTNDQTGAEIKVAYEAEADTNAFSDLAVTTLANALQNITGESIKDLSDVFTTMVPTDGQVLTYDTTNGWQAETVAAGAGAVDSVAGKTGVVTLVKADITDFVEGDYATGAEGDLATSALQGVTAELIGSLSNVDETGKVNGSILKYNGTNWIVGTDATAGGSTALNDLSDVTLTAAATGEVLRYNGTAWVDAALVKADISDFVEADYATGAEGDLAASALQSGSNISVLTNDTGYLTGGSVINDLADVVITAATVGEVLIHNGTNWVDAALTKADISDFVEGDYATGTEGNLATSALQNVTEDTTPQLGGNLDVQTNKIVSTGTNDIVLDFADQTGTGGLSLQAGGVPITRATIVGGSMSWDFGVLGAAIVTGIRTPVNVSDAATKNYVDTEVAAIVPGIANVVEDGSPQLAADLDAQSNSIRNVTAISGNTNTSGLGFVSNDMYLYTANGTNILLTDSTLTASTDVKIRNVADPILAQDVATKNYVDSFRITDAQQTTDATVTVLSTTAIATDEEKILRVRVHGHEDATDDHIWKTMTFGVKNIAGVASLVGGVDAATGYDAGAGTWTIVAGVSSGNATITITGEAAHTIDWRATIEID